MNVQDCRLHAKIQNQCCKMNILHVKNSCWVQLERIAGPLSYKPILNLECSQVGLIPKKTIGFRLITHLSYPVEDSVNDFIYPALASVQYSSFENLST